MYFLVENVEANFLWQFAIIWLKYSHAIWKISYQLTGEYIMMTSALSEVGPRYLLDSSWLYQ